MRPWKTISDPGRVLHYRGSFVSASAFMLSLVVNGSPHVCRSPAATIADLVRELEMEGKRVAVERNGEIVPRSRHALTPLAAGDRIEVVAAVGGG